MAVEKAGEEEEEEEKTKGVRNIGDTLRRNKASERAVGCHSVHKQGYYVCSRFIRSWMGFQRRMERVSRLANMGSIDARCRRWS